MRSPLVLLALLWVAVPLAVAAPVPKSLKKNPTIEGNWRMQSREADGKVDPPPGGDYNLWKVDGDTMLLVREGDNTAEGVYPCRLVSEVKPDGPRTFEYKVDKNGYHRRGVCELDGDTLRIAFGPNGNPPAEVKSENGSGVTVYTFKRVEAAK